MAAKGRHIVRRSLAASTAERTDWERVRALSDKDIERAVAEDADAAPLLDAEWFRRAKVIYPPDKGRITIRIDQDILDFFRKLGPRYQTRINAVLRAYVTQAQRPQRRA